MEIGETKPIAPETKSSYATCSIKDKTGLKTLSQLAETRTVVGYIAMFTRFRRAESLIVNYRNYDAGNTDPIADGKGCMKMYRWT